jgi:hypothetical protein
MGMASERWSSNHCRAFGIGAVAELFGMRVARGNYEVGRGKIELEVVGWCFGFASVGKVEEEGVADAIYLGILAVELVTLEDGVDAELLAGIGWLEEVEEGSFHLAETL